MTRTHKHTHTHRTQIKRGHCVNEWGEISRTQEKMETKHTRRLGTGN